MATNIGAVTAGSGGSAAVRADNLGPIETGDRSRTGISGPMSTMQWDVARNIDDPREGKVGSFRGAASYFTVRGMNCALSSILGEFGTGHLSGNSRAGMAMETTLVRPPPAAADGSREMVLSLATFVSTHDYRGRPASSVFQAGKAVLPDLVNRLNSNAYIIKAILPNGKVIQTQWKPDRAELVVAREITIPCLPGDTIIESWPVGSAGVPGYEDGRRLIIHNPNK